MSRRSRLIGVIASTSLLVGAVVGGVLWLTHQRREAAASDRADRLRDVIEGLQVPASFLGGDIEHGSPTTWVPPR